MQIVATDGKKHKQLNLTQEDFGAAPGMNQQGLNVVKQGTLISSSFKILICAPGKPNIRAPAICGWKPFVLVEWNLKFW